MRGRGLGTRLGGASSSSTNHLHSILRYAESSWGFTEIKFIESKFAGGPMGINAWNTFVLRVEHPYNVGKLEISLDMGELTFHAEKTACYQLQQQT